MAAAARDTAAPRHGRPPLVAMLAAGLTLLAVTAAGVAVSDRAPAGRTADTEVALPTPGALSRGPGAAPDARTQSGCIGEPGAAACLRWAVRAGSAPPAQVVLDDRDIVLTEGDGTVRVLSRTSGVERWRVQLDGQPRLQPTVAGTVPVTVDGVTSFLELAGGRVVGSFEAPVTRAASSGPWLLTSGGGELSAWSVSGSAGWTVPVPPDRLAWTTSNGHYLSGTPAVFSDEVVRLSSNTGEQRWGLAVDGRVAGIHAVASGTLIVVEDTGRGAALIQVDRSGLPIATHPVAGRVAWVSVADDGTIAVVIEGPAGANLLLLDGDTGTARPLAPLGFGAVASGPAAIGAGAVAVAHQQASPAITIVGRADGRIRQRIPLEAPARAVGLPGDATVVALLPGRLTAWALGTGAERWSLDLGDQARLVAAEPLLVRDSRALLALEPDPQRRRHERSLAAQGQDR